MKNKEFCWILATKADSYVMSYFTYVVLFAYP